MYLYIMNFPNSKRYVGITVDLGKRMSTHKSRAKCHPEFNECLYNAIRKYGWDNIVFEVADGYESWDELCNVETQLIEAFNTTNRDYGYNVSAGGDGYAGFTHTDEWKQRMSERMSGENNPSWGRKLTDEQKMHLSEINSGEMNPRYGKPISDFQKKSLNDGFATYCEEHGHPWVGKRHTNDTIRKQSESKLGGKNPMFGKRPASSKLTNDQVISIRSKYASGNYNLLELALEFGVCQSTIHDIVRKRKYKRVK
jgi:group I intron endonuclease